MEVITGGNHIWDRQRDHGVFPARAAPAAAREFPAGAPGSGLYVGPLATTSPIAVLCVQGRDFMAPLDDPFRMVDRELAKIPAEVKVIFVDMHAEATSRKIWPWAGISTAEFPPWSARIPTCPPPTSSVLPGGTAYITDVGMTGPHDGVIGMEKRSDASSAFATGMPARFEVATATSR